MPAKTAVNSKDVKIHPPKFFLILATVFLTIWIIIGLFIFTVIISQLKQGAFRNLLGGNVQTQQPTVDSQPSQEADLPGVGKVNVKCVRDSLSQESITKIVEIGNSSSLSKEEKDKLDECVIENSSSPTPSPSS